MEQPSASPVWGLGITPGNSTLRHPSKTSGAAPLLQPFGKGDLLNRTSSLFISGMGSNKGINATNKDETDPNV